MRAHSGEMRGRRGANVAEKVEDHMPREGEVKEQQKHTPKKYVSLGEPGPEAQQTMGPKTGQ